MLAGHPALDLANTLHQRKSQHLDFIPDYESLVEWCVPAQLLKQSEAQTLLELAKKNAVMAGKFHQQWVELRFSFKLWLQGGNHDATQTSEKIGLIKKIGAVTATAQLRDLVPNSDALNIDLPLLRCAVEIWRLVEFPTAAKVRMCEADQCGGFFLDESRAKPRRWCSMDSCGNRIKAARHRHQNQTTDPR